MRLVLALALALSAAPACAGVIGVSLPSTGRYAALGRELEMGILKAIEDHVARGGERPRIAPVDDECSADGGRKGLETLRERGAEVLIGVPCFEPALLYAGALDVPILAAGLRHAAAEEEVEAGRLNVLGPAPRAEAQAAADLVLSRWRDRPFAIVDDGGVYGRALAEAVRDLAETRGLRPQQLATFRPLQSTQAALVRRLKNAGVEAVFVAGEAEDAATIARDGERQGGLEVATGETGALLPYVDGAAQTPPILSVARPARRDAAPDPLMKQLRRRGDFPSDPFLEGYALAQVALDYLSTGEPVRRTRYRTVLGELDFSTGRAVAQPFELMRWTGTALEPAAE